MKSTAQVNSPAPFVTAEAESHEDWSDIWAREDPAISGADPLDQAPVDPADAGQHL